MNKTVIEWKSPEDRFIATRGNSNDTLASPHPSGGDGLTAVKDSAAMHENGAGTQALSSLGCDCGGYTGLRNCWDSFWNGTGIPSCLC